MPEKVVVGMSGGTDSTVTAYLLKTQGYEVIGVTLYLYDNVNSPRSCCTLDAINRARMMCIQLGIRHYTVDLRDVFQDTIIRFFVEGYARGLTPNPCVLCNRIIKFEHLIHFADKAGAQWVATGHYARIINGRIVRPKDRRKDQTYFLALVHREFLPRILFPLGDMEKYEVQALAKARNLIPPNLVESQDICFVDDGDYRKFLDRVLPKKPGRILDLEGRVLGTHPGTHYFTLGQRKGLGVHLGHPVYVVKIDPKTGDLVVGPRDALMKKRIRVGALNLHEDLKVGDRVDVMIRYLARPAPATITTLQATECTVEFDEPQWNPTPGQLAAFYKGDTLVGGGFILPEDAPS